LLTLFISGTYGLRYLLTDVYPALRCTRPAFCYVDPAFVALRPNIQIQNFTYSNIFKVIKSIDFSLITTPKIMGRYLRA
jgi:hypothetical protein